MKEEFEKILNPCIKLEPNSVGNKVFSVIKIFFPMILGLPYFDISFLILSPISRYLTTSLVTTHGVLNG